jgi:proline iminopeptidase
MEGTFQGPGGTLAYEARGKGPGTPLVVINGGPGFDHTQLLLLPTAWDRLAQNRRVVFYDQRGTGRSFALKPGAPDTLEEQVADLEELRVHLKAERIDLLGHSSGGFIAMAYTARHATQVSHLILVDSQPPKTADARSLFGELFPEIVERQRAVESAKERGDKDAPGELRRLRRTMLFYSPDNRDLYLKLAQQLPFNQQVNTALSQDMERFDLTPEVKQFRMPVLVVTGRLDAVVSPSTAYTLHQEIPGSRFVVLERSGHLPFFEEPDAFARELDSFLTK